MATFKPNEFIGPDAPLGAQWAKKTQLVFLVAIADLGSHTIANCQMVRMLTFCLAVLHQERFAHRGDMECNPLVCC